MTKTLAMHVPEILRGYQGDLATALSKPNLMTWDDSVTFANAEQATAIGKVIAPVVHPHLLNANIAYVFKKAMKTRDRTVLGKASKASKEIEFFAGYDFVLKFNWEDWALATDMHKIALVDHELCHCGREEDPKTHATKWVTISHDVEEFGAVIHRWGLWKPDLIPFAGAIAHAQQIGLGLDAGRD